MVNPLFNSVCISQLYHLSEYPGLDSCLYQDLRFQARCFLRTLDLPLLSKAQSVVRNFNSL